LGILNFSSNFKEGLARDFELAKLQVQYDKMMKELEENIKNAGTDEERERLIALRQRIINEGKRARDEAERNLGGLRPKR